MKFRTTLLAIPLLTVALAPLAEAGWFHQENAVFRAETESQRHPKNLEQTIFLPRTADVAKICVAYSRDSSSSKRTRVVTKIEVDPRDGDTRRLKLVARVSGNRALKCRDVENVEAGTIFTFSHRFKKAARVRSSGGVRESVAVSGIVSTVGEPALSAGILSLVPEKGETPLGLNPGKQGGWFHSANSVLHVEQDGVAHPATMTRAIVIPRDSDSRPVVCTAYDRSSDVRGGGRVSTLVTIARDSGNIESLELVGEVEDNLAKACATAGRKVSEGDIVSFEAQYENMPELEKNSFTDLIAAVSFNGSPEFPPRSEVNDDPVPGSALSVADEHAAVRVLQGRKQQLVKPREGIPFKWMVIGPGTRADGNNKVIPSTAGYGPTIAAALADYENKQGSLGGQERRLTVSERDALNYYSRMSSVGPSAIRKDASGGFHGDVWRPWFGVKQGGPFGSMEAVVNWFKSIGL